jgi:hypothetical protein
MKLVANGVNKNFLASYLPTVGVEIDGVLAAIAYGNDDNEKIVDNCLELGCRLDIWMRYDETVPVQPALLRKFLRNSSKNIFCKVIPDALHSKVIWWRGYGAYIGSANLSGGAWSTNIEAGIFFEESEILSNGLDSQLEDFFETLENDCESYALSMEIVEEMEEFQKQRKEIARINGETRKKRKIGYWKGLSNVDKKITVDRKKQKFNKEWTDTIQILSDVAASVTEFRPKWMEETVPASWQADQFLHAFYYNQVKEGGNRYPFEEYFLKNKKNPASATRAALGWWSKLPRPPSEEDINLYTRAPYIRDHLEKDKILDLGVVELEKICTYTHATKNHVLKIRLADLGRPELTTLPLAERLPIYANWLLNQENDKGQNILQLLDYVLYGGKNSEIHERLYNAAKEPDYRISHYGLNSIAEVAGWALPGVVPPRNGRTSKALKALGYPVKIY